MYARRVEISVLGDWKSGLSAQPVVAGILGGVDQYIARSQVKGKCLSAALCGTQHFSAIEHLYELLIFKYHVSNSIMYLRYIQVIANQTNVGQRANEQLTLFSFALF